MSMSTLFCRVWKLRATQPPPSLVILRRDDTSGTTMVRSTWRLRWLLAPGGRGNKRCRPPQASTDGHDHDGIDAPAEATGPLEILLPHVRAPLHMLAIPAKSWPWIVPRVSHVEGLPWEVLKITRTPVGQEALQPRMVAARERAVGPLKPRRPMKSTSEAEVLGYSNSSFIRDAFTVIGAATFYLAKMALLCPVATPQIARGSWSVPCVGLHGGVGVR